MRRCRSEDDGFTIAEVLVALLVISGGILGLLAMQVRSLSTVGLAGQRQTATGLTNRAMEQLRALPYGSITGGLDCADLAGDADVVVSGSGSGCTASFRPAYDSTINETLVTSTGAQIAPLNPHVQPAAATRVGVVDYTVKDYVTRVDSSVTSAGYWLTVVTTWKSAVTKGRTIRMAARSLLYSPEGCQSNHPFAGPCQPFLYSDAGVRPATVRVETLRPGLGIVDGIDLLSGSMTLRNLTTRTASEQITSGSAMVSTTKAEGSGSAGALSTSGGVPAPSNADTDPATGVSSNPAAASSAVQAATPLSVSGSGRTFSLTPDSTGGGSAFATTAASSSPACEDQSGTAQTTGQVCSSAKGAASSASTARLDLGGTVGSFVLADVAASNAVNRAFSGRFVAGTSSHCTSTTGAGCTAAAVVRSLGAVTAGGLPVAKSGDVVRNAAGADVTTSIGAGPLVSLAGYSDSTYAESGLSPLASSASRSGTLRYWNGTGYSAPVTLPSSGTAPPPYVIPTVTGTYSGSTTVSVGGTVTVTLPSVTAGGSSPCSSAACTSAASGGSVIAQLTYTVSNGGAVIGSFTVSVDLGTALSKTSYKAAASGA